MKKKVKKTYKVTNAKNPIIVKKQSKYNINRWAVCGKDNLLLNTYCWRIFNYLKTIQKNKIYGKNFVNYGVAILELTLQKKNGYIVKTN